MGSAFERVVAAEHVRPLEDEAIDGVPVVEVVRPGSAEEVAACLALAADAEVALVASGGGTRLAWGNRPRAETLVRLDLSRLAGPLDLQPAEGIATLGAGVRIDALSDAARELGQGTRLDAAAGGTVGGAIAADPPAADFSLDRRLRNDLLGLQVALPRSGLTRCGGRVVKNVTGFDLVRLYCGSLGTLGVITEATLRLRPLPEARRVLARACGSLDAAGVAARELVGAGAAPDGTAILPREGGADLVWQLEGGERDVAERAARFEGEQAPDLWEAARAVAAGRGVDPDRTRVRLATRPTDTAGLIQALSETGAPRLALPLAGLAWGESSEDAVPALLERAAGAHWAAFVERAGPGLKERIDVFGAAPDSLALMRALKARFDPDGVLAPGRFLGRL